MLSQLEVALSIGELGLVHLGNFLYPFALGVLFPYAIELVTAPLERVEVVQDEERRSLCVERERERRKSLALDDDLIFSNKDRVWYTP